MTTVYKCCIVNCPPNCIVEESKTAFSFPKEEDLKKDSKPIFLSYVCIRHFEEKYKKGKNIKCYSLAIIMKPVPTIFNPKTVINKNSEKNNVTSPITISRRSPRKHLYQEEQYESFISKD